MELLFYFFYKSEKEKLYAINMARDSISNSIHVLGYSNIELFLIANIREKTGNFFSRNFNNLVT